MSITNQIKQLKTGARLSVDGQTMFVVATTRLHEVRGQPPARQGSDPYTMISLADGKTILLHIREEEQGAYAWFLFTKSDEPTKLLMPVCAKCSKDQRNHFDFDFAGMALTARDFGGVNCESMDGAEEVASQAPFRTEPVRTASHPASRPAETTKRGWSITFRLQLIVR